MRSQLFRWSFVVATLFFATIDPAKATAQHHRLNPAPAVRVAPNVTIFPQIAPIPSYYPYPVMFYSSYGYSYPGYPIYSPVAYPTPVYVPPYHAALYSSYYYPVGYGYYYYRGW